MAQRDQRAIDMQEIFSCLINGYSIPPSHPLGSIELLKRFVQDTCPGLDINNIDPAFRQDNNRNVNILSKLLFECLRAVTLFHFGLLASNEPDSDEFRGAIILAARSQFTGRATAGFVSMQSCFDKLSQASSIARHINQLWTAFNTEFNVNLPGENRLAQPNPMPDSTIFTGLTTTSFARYQDAELIWLYNRLRNAAAALSLPFPDEMPALERPKGKAKVTESTSKITTSGQNRILSSLRNFVAKSTEFLPMAFRPAALEPAVPAHVGQPPLQLLRQMPDNVVFPSDAFITPAIRLATYSKERLIGGSECSPDDLLALPAFAVVGNPGAGKRSLLTYLAHLVSVTPPRGTGPSLMILIDAVEYAAQAGSQWLPAYAAQKLQSAGCMKDLSVNELAMHLETFHKTGRLCWGVSQVDSLGDKLEAVAFQIKQSNCYIVTLNIAPQSAIQKVQTTFGGLHTVLIQPFDQERIHRYCTHYAEIACKNFDLASALHDTKSHPNLATLPLGLACICAVAGNHRRLQNPIFLYMAERFCRAGLKPDLEFAHSSKRQPVMQALCNIAVGYWRTNKTLEVGESIPMTREFIEQWATRWSDTKAALEILSSLYSTRLIVPSHDKDQFIFAQPEVYRWLLAIGYLDQREQQRRRMLFGWEVERAFGSELPKEIVEMITGLADERCRAAGLDGDG